jgi:arsenite methyltransferase
VGGLQEAAMSSSLDRLREEFDRWAHEGRGEKMEKGHQAVTEIILDRMDLKPDSHVLDLGCGIGWATRLLAARLPHGMAVGLDVSEEMIRRAREHGANPPNVNFRVLRSDRFPFQDGVFTHCLSVESLYYHPDITTSLREVHRVLVPGSAAYVMMNFFKENPYTQRWAGLIKVPVHWLGGEEYCALAREAGFARARWETVPDPTPVPDHYDPVHYESREAMQESLAIGALLVTAER